MPQKIYFRPFRGGVNFFEIYRCYENVAEDFPDTFIQAIEVNEDAIGRYTIVDDMDDRTSTYYVDIPPLHGGDEWVNVVSYKTKAEAIAYAKEHYGADDEGNIRIISVS